MSCRDLCTFWKILGKKKCFSLVKNTALGQEVHYYTVYIAFFTESNLPIYNYAKNLRICHEKIANTRLKRIFWPLLRPPRGCQCLPPWFFYFSFLQYACILSMGILKYKTQYFSIAVKFSVLSGFANLYFSGLLPHFDSDQVKC